MTLLRSTVRTARIWKRCRLCLCEIWPGERYNDDRFADGGIAYAWPTHQFCLWLADELEFWDPCDGTVDQGAVAEQWHEFVTQPWDDPLHQLVTVIGWWAQWRLS